MVVKELERWTALPEAAEKLGLAKQGLHFRVNQGLVPARDVRYVRMGQHRLLLISDRYIDDPENSVTKEDGTG